MPIYQYKCLSCEKITEKKQRYNDPPPNCGHCEGKTRKIITTVAHHFKGNGFYTNDRKAPPKGGIFEGKDQSVY